MLDRDVVLVVRDAVEQQHRSADIGVEQCWRKSASSSSATRSVQSTSRRPTLRPSVNAASVYEPMISGWTSFGLATTVPRPRRSILPATRSSRSA